MRIGSFWSLLFCLGLSSVAYAQDVGDVTGDGRVDGKDALKVARILEGLVEPTGEDLRLGDVYPVPGVERRIGDGRLTDEDVVRILRYSVGLISLKELRAVVLPRLEIVELDPCEGPVGTEVLIRGTGFIEGAPEEHVVKFGDVKAEVLEAGEGYLKVEVPNGARTGFVTVADANGLAVSPKQFKVIEVISGDLSLPGGLAPSDFVVLTSFGYAEPDSSGAFEVGYDPERASLFTALPKEEGGQIFMCLYVPTSGTKKSTGQGVTIDAMSTAVSMVFMSPSLATRAPLDAALVKETAEDDPKVAELASVIEERYPSISEPWEDEEVLNAWREAIRSVTESLPEQDKVTVEQLRKGVRKRAVLRAKKIPVRIGTTPSGLEAILYPVDLSTLKVKVPGCSLYVEAVYSNPMDWVVRVNEVDLSDEGYGGGIAGITGADYKTAFPVRTDPGAFGGLLNVEARSVFTAFELLDRLNEYLYESFTGGAPEAIRFPDREAMYEIRMYSGCLADGDELFTAWDQLYHGREDIVYAVCLNLCQAIFDYADMVGLDVADWNSKAMNEIVNNVVHSMSNAFYGEFEAIRRDMSGYRIFLGGIAVVEAGVEELFNQASEYIIKEQLFRPGKVYSRTKWFKGVSSKQAKAMGKAAKKLLFWLEVFDKVGKLSKIVERVCGMAGWAPTMETVTNMDLTPMETAVVVVGDPFNPTVSSIMPEKGYTGTRLILMGNRLGKEKEKVKVEFYRGGKLKFAHPDEISPDQRTLVVTVPEGLTPGPYEVVVVTPKGRSYRVTSPRPTFTVLDRPLIDKVAPLSGFAASESFPYEGDRITISGWGFGPDDEVTFGGNVKAKPEYATYNNITVRIPSGAETGEIEVRSSKTKKSARGPVVKVLGPPSVTSMSPTEGPVGTSVTLEGENFGVVREAVKVLAANGKELYVERVDTTRLKVRMVTGAGTGPLTLVTPAGSCTTPPFKVTPGLARGHCVKVTVTTWGGDVPTDPEITFCEALKIVHGERLPYLDPRNTDDDPNNDVPDEWHNVCSENSISCSPPIDWHFGKDYANTILIENPGTISLPGDVELYPYDAIVGPLNETVELSGGSIVAAGDGVRLENLTLKDSPGAGIVLNEVADCKIRNLTIVGPKGHGVMIHGGRRNELSLEVVWAEGDGVHIEGGSGHKLSLRVYGCGGDGLEVQDASDCEISDGEFAGNAGHGIWLHGVGTKDCILKPFLRPILVGAKRDEDQSIVEMGNLKDGVLVSGRASGIKIFNLTSVANSGDGVRLVGVSDVYIFGLRAGVATGKGGKVVAMGNSGDGLEISSGTRGVKVLCFWPGSGSFSSVFGDNGGHGLLIAGAGTGDIYIEQSNFGVNINDNGKYGNQGSGIAILGDQEGSPYDISFYVCYVGDNKQYGVLLSKVAPPKDKPVTFTFVRNGHVGFGPWDRDRWAPNTLGCWRLEDGTRNVVMRGGEYVGSPVGIWFDGEGTSYNCQNLGDIVGTTEAAVLITNGAHHNELLGVKVHDNSGKGIVIDESDDNVVGPFDRKELWGPDEEFAYTRALGLEPFVDPFSLCGADPCYGMVADCGDVGVLISGDADRNLIRGQMIEGNNGDGILLKKKIGTMSVPDNTEISSCFFGSPALGGSSALVFKPNKGAGVHIAGATNTSIKDCRIESNDGPGILLEGELTRNTTIVGNRIGRTSADMPADMGNGRAGIEVLRGPKETIVGGHKPGERNVISGNGGAGILASGPNTVGLKILANYIGTDSDGVLGIGNNNEGIKIDDVEMVVIQNRNVISANGGDGILLSGVNGAVVRFNSLGTQKAAMANKKCGIKIEDGLRNTIAQNTILFTGQHGIHISGGGWNRITNNSIGIFVIPGPGGTVRFGNIPTHGIFLTDDTKNNVVAFNTIRKTGGNGIAIGAGALDRSMRNSLSSNSISGCQGKAIAFTAPGVQENIGPPEIVSVRSDRVYGFAPGAPDGSIVELFSDPDGEARVPLGKAKVRYAGGTAVLRGLFDYRGRIPLGFNVTATVTDLSGNTSELGKVVKWDFATLARPMLFVSTRDGNGEVYKTSTVLGLATPLTSDPSEDRDPAWSGDGRFVAFASDREGSYDIYVMGAEGDQVRRLTQGEWDDRMPSWSPDGERIAFVSDRDGNREIYIVNSDGTGLTRLTHDPGDDVMPSWSPDGNRIAFASDRDGDYEIYLVNPDGSGLTRLTYSSGDDTDPCWSPDGSRIAFASDRSGHFQIYTVPAEGGDAVLFVPTDLPARYPSWSPDGTRIAFAMEKDTDTEVYIAGMVPVQATISRGTDTYPAWGRR